MTVLADDVLPGVNGLLPFIVSPLNGKVGSRMENIVTGAAEFGGSVQFGIGLLLLHS